MAKSLWKGEISFGLVSIPVSLVSTEETKEHLHFHLVDAKSKARIRYQRVSEESGKEIPWNEIVKAYEYDKGNYIIVDEKAFEKKGQELFKTIDIDEFVDFKEIDNLYLAKPYYLVPESKNKKAYVLLREALKKTNKVGVAKIIIRSKESLSLIMPHDKALLLYLVHFKEELRDEAEMSLPDESLKAYKISDSELKMAITLIKDMSAEWQPEKYHNEYQETLRTWIDQQISKQSKTTGKTKKTVASKSPGAVVDFISLLKDSMKKSKKLKNRS